MLTLALVIPCYNEAEVIPDTSAQLLELFASLSARGIISDKSFILYVNDGSEDATWTIIKGLHDKHNNIKGLNLMGNVGQQNAMMAGMMVAKDRVDAVITIDADLQDDISMIETMIAKYENGADVVYGVRESRKVNGFFKRNSAKVFYRAQTLLGVNIVYNHADFRFLSKRVLDELSRYSERGLYLRGIVPLLGFPSDKVYYKFRERKAGKSKYTLGKMLNLGVDGITGFSVKPINLIIATGIIFLVVCFFMTLYILWSFFVGRAVSGWTSIMLSMWFIGAMILLSIGVIGKYIGNIFAEVKRRPLYNIESFLD